MLAMRARVVPCMARDRRSSPVRSTTTALAAESTFTFTEEVRVKVSLFLPLSTTTSLPLTATLTLSGTGTGFLPMRDIFHLVQDQEQSSRCWSVGSFNGAEQFAADLLGAGLTIREHTLGGADDRDAQAGERARQVGRLLVHAAARLALAGEAVDQLLAARAVLQLDAEDALPAVGDDVVAGDVAFLFEY